jgi:hypothetical protein
MGVKGINGASGVITEAIVPCCTRGREIPLSEGQFNGWRLMYPVMEDGQTWPRPTLLGKSKPLALELDRRD